MVWGMLGPNVRVRRGLCQWLAFSVTVRIMLQVGFKRVKFRVRA